MKKFRFIHLLANLLTLLALVSCGGGDSGGTPLPPPEPPQPPVTGVPPETTFTSGVITGFGSVFINGVEYETGGAEISNDDESGSESDLQLGMFVELSGSIDDGGVTGTAKSIEYDEQIKGPLESIDLGLKIITILGQVIHYDDLTIMENLVPEELKPGDFLEVHGFFNQENELHATRIELESIEQAYVRVQGEVFGLNSSDETFTLNNLIVDYSQAEFHGFDNGAADLVNGVQVRVKGALTSLVDGVLTVSDIKRLHRFEEHEEGDLSHIEGVITEFTSSVNFVVNNIVVIAHESTEVEHGGLDDLSIDSWVKVKGSFDAEGRLVAEKIHIHHSSQLRVEGEVTALNPDMKTITVIETLFHVTDQTQMHDESDDEERFFNFESIMVGDFVSVKGFVDSDGDNIASQIERENHRDEHHPYVELKGPVNTITDSGFTLVGVAVTVNDQTMFKGAFGEEMERETFFGQLVDGMILEVKVIETGDGVVAIRVEIEGEHGDGEGGEHHMSEFRGQVEEILENGLLVSGLRVSFTSMTHFEVEDSLISMAGFLEIVQIGDDVEVKGMRDGGELIAHKVELEDDSDD
ncbi:DUF5666 domain-containing protein [uncultured Shewanella sp.]|uniref:DUF5666 domain-containing protein n=1 Tax=Shewanella atlantica TaxID=271099 RepID=UPI00261F4A87|nr:DUF5666 domain-containing protein [uncultured Shewanella sp.]